MKPQFYYALMILFGLFHFSCLSSQEKILKSKVDERIELVGIIYRLAEAQEFSQGKIKSYNENTDNYFADFKNHEAVKQAKEYRNNSIGYDAVMSLAVHLNIKGSSVTLSDDIYNNLDGRWNKEMLDKMTKKISDFYVKTDFRKFFEANSHIYAEAEQAMNEVLKDKMDFSWFNRFFGVKGGDYTIYISLTNGPGNYGTKVIHDNKEEDICPIIGVGADGNGEPAFSVENTVLLLVHEIGHSYCNPIVNKHIEEFKKTGEVVFPHISKIMQSQAYGNWNTVMYEALVRVSVICYASQDTILNFKIGNLIAYETSRGFFWMADLYKLMKEYESNREKYATLDHFMPHMISFYNMLATKVDGKTELFSKIISSSIENDSKIPYTIKELILKFSKPMDTKKGYGFGYGKGGKERFPAFEKIEWVDDKTIKLMWNLEQGKTYSLQLYLPAYIDTEGLPVLENYHLEFSTE